jgi:hypothetical protein
VRIFALAVVVFAASIAGVGQAASAFTTSKGSPRALLASGLKPDGWGASISQAESAVAAYPGVLGVACYGVAMRLPGVVVVARFRKHVFGPLAVPPSWVGYWTWPGDRIWPPGGWIPLWWFSGSVLYDSRSEWVYGMTRYWDKLWCLGTAAKRRIGQPWLPVKFSLVFDPKSRTRWVIYRLRGVSIGTLWEDFNPFQGMPELEFVKLKP